MAKIVQVDSFTSELFKGNPAAVCLLEKQMDDSWMQNIAREMNLSETAFLFKIKDGYKLRWFTPVMEVDLCGHATLASAHVLYEEGLLSIDQQARFHTRSGVLTVIKKGDWLEMDFPAQKVTPVDVPPVLSEAVGPRPVYTGKNKTGYLFKYESEEQVRELKPHFHLLREMPVQEIIVTAKSAVGEYDFVSRFFAPNLGINEDPVTGSAHCSLGPFWQGELCKSDFLAYQASERGGVIKVGVRGDRVKIGGQAITLFRGTLKNS